MLKHFATIPIFRRLFLAFFLAVLIPDGIMVLQGMFYTNALIAHGMPRSQMGPLTIEIILALIFSTGTVIFLGYLMNRTITQPLSQLATLARRIRQGETSARAPTIGRDEIAVVGSLINEMLDQIVSQKEYTEAQIEQLIDEVSGVGKGDLRIQAEVTSGSLGVIADFFNYMVEALSSLVVRVKQVTREVEQATTTTQQAMDALVVIADKQLQEIGSTVQTVEVMAHNGLEVGERTKNLAHMAQEAQRAVQEGRQAIQQALAGSEIIQQKAQQATLQMKTLEQRSQEVDEIVRVLEIITHQTNRLALDASIQVALAGNTTNSGFGAVAEGIRRLSEQTKKQLNSVTYIVKSIRTEMSMMTESIQESERTTTVGVTRIQATGTALATIFSLIEQQAGEIETIHRMMEQLLQASRVVSLTMSTLSESTARSSTSTRAVAREMIRMAMLVKQLRTSVEVFQVKETMGPLSPRSQHASAL
jgi:methyl-accepting chemotaxis protein